MQGAKQFEDRLREIFAPQVVEKLLVNECPMNQEEMAQNIRDMVHSFGDECRNLVESESEFYYLGWSVVASIALSPGMLEYITGKKTLIQKLNEVMKDKPVKE